MSRLLMRATRALCCGAVLVVASHVGAQASPVIDDPFAQALFEPELIMKHRRDINLTDEQRDAISRLIRELQGQVVSLQWELQDDVAGLTAELRKPRIDLDRAQDRLARVMATERKIKEAHLTLLVRIKNALRPDQQEALQKFKTSP
jgi:Spy/CpxP family protein refolding chaperone